MSYSTDKDGGKKQFIQVAGAFFPAGNRNRAEKAISKPPALPGL
jgi:hypothetical protein